MDNDIVQVCGSVDTVGSEGSVHEPLEHCWGPVEAEGKEPVLPVSASSAEGHLLAGFRGQWHLPIAFREVHVGDETGLPEVLDQVLHSRQRVAVKHPDCIQLAVVIAHSQASVGLVNCDNWAGPGIVGCRPGASSPHLP